MKTFLLVFMSMLAFATHAQAVKDGMPFLQARKNVMREGWSPRKTHINDGYDFSRTEKNLLRRGLSEVESCAMDRPYCVFNYERAGQCFRVVTVGEDVRDMKVAQWSNDCPQ